MSRRAVDAYFREYAFGFMENDIQRELTFAHTPLGAGNVLAALGLVVYTEVLGRIWTRNMSKVKLKNAPNFDACFDMMGMGYASWRAAFERREKPRTLYSALRNGLAHEYSPKVPFNVVMFGKPPLAIVRQRGRYDFVVEAYLRDFRTAARRIHADVMASANPHIPRPD